jgi:D-3-phosphoglycerate dehydrogenase
MTEKVALLDSINPAAHDVFKQADFDIITFPKSIQPAGLVAIAHEVELLGVRSGPQVTADMLHDSLHAISVFGVGTNHIERQNVDKTGADDQGIAIFNAAHENTRSVAELVIGNTFALMRGTANHHRALHDGTWTKEDGSELRGKTMGIIGYGAIGVQVSVMAEALNMDVVAYDPNPPVSAQGRAQLLNSVEEVLQAADVVTLHIPGGKDNRHYINDERIGLMKQGSYLINAARGELVDYDAVAQAIHSGQLAGAAIDVFEDKESGIKEPAKKGDDFDHVLRGHHNVLLTPHIGGSTIEAQSSIGRQVALKSVAYLATGNSVGSVNMPPLTLGALESGTSRLLNVHDNQTGVMAEVTGLIAEAGLNAVDTKQRVKGDLGYLAIDLEGTVPKDVLRAISELAT